MKREDDYPDFQVGDYVATDFDWRRRGVPHVVISIFRPGFHCQSGWFLLAGPLYTDEVKFGKLRADIGWFRKWNYPFQPDPYDHKKDKDEA